MTHITYRNGVFIAVLVVYIPALAIAVYLTIRDGWKARTGRLLATFAIARLLTGGLQLGTISSPNNISLWAGYITTLNISISILLSCCLTLLNRLLGHVREIRPTTLRPFHTTAIHIFILAGLALGIAGGIMTNDSWGSTGVYRPKPLSQASAGIFCAAVGLVIMLTIYVHRVSTDIDAGERRVIFAVALSLPFLMARVIYTAVSAFANPTSLNAIFGNVTILLFVALIPEMVTVALYEGVLLAIPRKAKTASRV